MQQFSGPGQAGQLPEHVRVNAVAGTPNVIILTSGLSGSSLLAGLLSRAGYWAGTETVRKPDYDTYENAGLVALNDQLLRQVAYPRVFLHRMGAAGLKSLHERLARVPDAPYRAFAAACGLRSPFVWKDPRLWITIGFWLRLLPTDTLRVIIITRDPWQTWVSHSLRRQIISPGYCRRYLAETRAAALSAVQDFEVAYQEVSFEALMRSPAETLRGLSTFLGTPVDPSHLAAAQLAGMPWRHGVADALMAWMIYFKNFFRRLR